MRAKSSFFATLGILALATAYHLGATTAKAQSGALISVGQILGGTGSYDSNSVSVEGRTLFGRQEGTTGGVSTSPVPGSDPIVAVSADWGYTGGPRFYALLGNGDSYRWTSGTDWVREGSVFGGAPVPVARQSWGQLKARYR